VGLQGRDRYGRHSKQQSVVEESMVEHPRPYFERRSCLAVEEIPRTSESESLGTMSVITVPQLCAMEWKWSESQDAVLRSEGHRWTPSAVGGAPRITPADDTDSAS
jgi:hypothetical protein